MQASGYSKVFLAWGCRELQSLRSLSTVFFSSLIFALHTVIRLIDDRKRNNHQQLPTTTKVKHLLFSFTCASSIVFPLVSVASLVVTVILFRVWSALKRNHEDVKSRQSTMLGQCADQVYILVKSHLVEDGCHGQGESPRQQEVSDESLSRRELEEADSGVGEDGERDESTDLSDRSQPHFASTETFRQNTSMDGEEPVDCGRDVMRDMHAQDMGKIFEKVARRLVSRKPIFRLLPEADVNRVIAEQVSRTEVLANQWMRLWQQGAHQRLPLSDIWRLLLDVQEQALQNRLLMLLPGQRS